MKYILSINEICIRVKETMKFNFFQILFGVLFIQLEKSFTYSLVRPTPCTRICRYNQNFYDGQVCIGCFRDTVEISSWSKLSSFEKGLALEDASERLASTQVSFEGAISLTELKEQARLWMNINDDK